MRNTSELQKENDAEVNSPKKRWTATNKRRSEKKKSIPSIFSTEFQEAISSEEAAKHYFVGKDVFVSRTICPSDVCVGDLVKMQRTPLGNLACCSDTRTKDKFFRCLQCNKYCSEYEPCVLDRDIILGDLNKFLFVALLVIVGAGN